MEILTGIRAAFTVITFITFVGIVIWAYSKSARSGFDEAERLPLDEPTGSPAAIAPPRNRN